MHSLVRRLVSGAAFGAAVSSPLLATEALIPVAFTTEWMDQSADPRQDFYQYANGGWQKQVEIPADKSRWGAFDILGENNWRRIRGILEETAAQSGAPGSISQKVGDFYATAMDEAAIDAAGLQPLAPELALIEAIATPEDLARYVAQAHNRLGSPLFGSYIYADQKNNDAVIFILSQGGLSLPTRDYYFDATYAKFLPQFEEHVARMLVLAGAPEEAAKADAAGILRLETALAQVSKTVTELRDPIANYNKMPVAEAAAQMPAFPLATYLQALGVPASEKEINVAQPAFFAGLSRQLAERPLAEWKTYLRWRALSASAPYLARPFADENFRFFSTVLNGTPQQEPRWLLAAREL